jgi:hypothetical protein
MHTYFRDYYGIKIRSLIITFPSAANRMQSRYFPRLGEQVVVKDKVLTIVISLTFYIFDMCVIKVISLLFPQKPPTDQSGGPSRTTTGPRTAL